MGIVSLVDEVRVPSPNLSIADGTFAELGGNQKGQRRLDISEMTAEHEDDTDLPFLLHRTTHLFFVRTR